MIEHDLGWASYVFDHTIELKPVNHLENHMDDNFFALWEGRHFRQNVACATQMHRWIGGSVSHITDRSTQSLITISLCGVSTFKSQFWCSTKSWFSDRSFEKPIFMLKNALTPKTEHSCTFEDQVRGKLVFLTFRLVLFITFWSEV